jgi:hypothetical protein
VRERERKKEKEREERKRKKERERERERMKERERERETETEKNKQANISIHYITLLNNLARFLRTELLIQRLLLLLYSEQGLVPRAHFLINTFFIPKVMPDVDKQKFTNDISLDVICVG